MSTERSVVLIVDDNEETALALHRVLYREDNDRMDVLLAKQRDTAKLILTNTRVDVLVITVASGDGSEIELLKWVSDKSRPTRMILATSNPAAFRDRAYSHGCVAVLPHPMDASYARTTILAAIAQRETFTGGLAEFSGVDLIQMLCLARKTLSLRITGSQTCGVVLLRGGEAIHAVYGDSTGEDALFKLLALQDGHFTTGPLPMDVEQTIHRGWQYLLIEAMRRQDEISGGLIREGPDPDSRSSAPVMRTLVRPIGDSPTSERRPLDGGGEGTVPAPVLSGAKHLRVAELIDQGFDALRNGRRDDARLAWEEALHLDPSNRAVESNLRKLSMTPAESTRLSTKVDPIKIDSGDLRSIARRG